MIINKHRINNIIAIIPLSLIAVVCLSISVLPSATVSAADNTSVVDKINITVPVSCTMSGTGMNTHNAEITNGTYNSAIGETTLKAFCNDNEGFAIYAIGYTDNLNGKNVMTNATLGSTYDIPTGTLTTGLNSQWAMKLSTITTPQPTYPIIIAGSSDDTEREQGDPDFTSFQQIPNDYTLVAKRTGGTDIGTNAEGSTLKTTYQAYISQTQPAGTYTGQVKYTLIHPHDEPTPPSSMLQTGHVVNAKVKSLVAGTNKTFNDQDKNIKAIHMASSLPANFEATEANTVSTPDSKYPIYIFFDNTNDAGILYFYTENDTVVMNPDSSYLFMLYSSLEDISGLADWDASKVFNTNMMFYYDRALSSLHYLENWDTSSVTNLMGTFAYNRSLTDISALSSWDLSNATNTIALFADDTSLTSVSAIEDWDVSSVWSMQGMFSGVSSLISLDLSRWDVSNVRDMSTMFSHATSLETVNTTGWDTSNVINMNSMFQVGKAHEGDGLLTEIIGLEDWDVSNVTDMTCMFYGAGKMTHYDIADWDVSKVQSFNHMFADNFKLESLDLSKWDVSSLKTIWNMFNDASSLTTVGDISHWNTVNLIDAGGFLTRATAFVGDNGTLDLSGWNTTSLKAMYQMFSGTNLYNIDLSGWTFDSITDQAWEGAGSGIYYSYSLAGFGTAFQNTPNLEHVYLSQTGLDSFNAAVNRGINTTDMWSGSNISGFTVK